MAEPVNRTYPFDAIVRVDVTFHDGTFAHGSGVMIAPDEVLSASHVVWDVDHGGAADKVTVTPALDGADAPFGSIAADVWHYYKIDDAGGQVNKANSSFDVSLIHLSHPVQDGTMEIGINASAGYHYDDGYPGNPGLSMGTAVLSMALDLDQAHLWTFPSSLGAGNSGGPLWDYDATDHAYVMGVDSTGQWAPRIDDLLFSQIDQWFMDDHPNHDESLVALNNDGSLWAWA